MAEKAQTDGERAVSGRSDADRAVTRAVDREEAFRYWYAEGERRTHAAVAEHFDVALRTVQKWATDEDWSARAAGIDRQAQERADADLVKGVARRLRLQHAAVEQSLAQFIRNVQAGNLNLTPGEALAWAKHGHLLDGGATERVVGVTPAQDEARQRIADAIADELGDLSDEQVAGELELHERDG